MVAEIRIYFEGDKLLRPGFHAFFAELREIARAKRCAFQLISGGSGPTAERDFKIALKQHPKAMNILLRDSEGPLDHPPKDSVYWMVEMMESWFHADKDNLEKFYGQGFDRSALAANPKVEEISKSALVKGLKTATKKTAKGDYYKNKTSHGQKLLELIRPEAVQSAAPNCKKLFEAIRVQLAES